MSEKSEVRRDKAKAQKNSGRGQFSKGDAKWKFFLVDYKEAARSFTLNKNVWGKVCTDAFAVNKDLSPVLKIILGENNGKTRLAIVEWSLLEQLIEAYERVNTE